MLQPELPLMKRNTFGKLHFSNSSTVYPYFGSMCMPVAKMCTSNSGGSASSVRISDFILPKSARGPDRNTILRGPRLRSLATDVAPREERVRGDIARGGAAEHFFVARRQDLARPGALHPEVVARKAFSLPDAGRRDDRGVGEIDRGLLLRQNVLGAS